VKLELDGQERIPASADAVWAFITDPAKVGSCLPEATAIKVHDARHFDAAVRVAVGFVRGSFNLKVELQPDEATRHLAIKVTGGGFGSTIDLAAAADDVAAGEGEAILDWRGSAEMRGPVAAVGGRVLEAQAKKLLTHTFANVREKLTEVKR
jgi:carbon monoxide dehydrogenase subunit G